MEKKLVTKLQTMLQGRAATRGTHVHHMCEDYLNNVHLDFPDEWQKHEKRFLPYVLFKQLRDSVIQKDR